MTYFIHYEPPGHTSDDFIELDGDMLKVVPEDQSVDVGVTPPLGTHAFRCGRWVSTEFLPTQIRAKGRKRRLPDFGRCARGQFVSAAFRDIVESLEPGAHQFVPVDVLWKDGSSAGEFYWFATGRRLQTLALDLLYPPLKPNKSNWTDIGEDGRLVKNARHVFDSKLIGDAHVWSDLHTDGYIAVSDRFKALVEEAGLIGIRFQERETV
ncbi:MAG: DUF1629 domain-containing protein [Pseudomonadota bacterium]